MMRRNNLVHIKTLILVVFLIFGCENSDNNHFIKGYYEGTSLAWSLTLHKDFSFTFNRTLFKTTSIKGRWKKTTNNDIELSCFNTTTLNYCQCGIIRTSKSSSPYALEALDKCEQNYLLDIQQLGMALYVTDNTFFSIHFSKD